MRLDQKKDVSHSFHESQPPANLFVLNFHVPLPIMSVLERNVFGPTGILYILHWITITLNA